MKRIERGGHEYHGSYIEGEDVLVISDGDDKEIAHEISKAIKECLDKHEKN